MLFCLSLLQELIGLNTSLSSLFSFRAGESDLEDLGIIQYSPETLGKKTQKPSALLIWCISNKLGALVPMSHPLLSVPSVQQGPVHPASLTQAQGQQDQLRFAVLSFHSQLSSFLMNCWTSIKRKMWTYSNLLNIIFSFILGWITTCQKTQKWTHHCSERTKAGLGPHAGRKHTENSTYMGSILPNHAMYDSTPLLLWQDTLVAMTFPVAVTVPTTTLCHYPAPPIPLPISCIVPIKAFRWKKPKISKNLRNGLMMTVLLE